MNYKIQLIMPTSMGAMKDDFPQLFGEKDSEPSKEDIVNYIKRAGYDPNMVRWNVMVLNADQWDPVVGLEDNNKVVGLRVAGKI